MTKENSTLKIRRYALVPIAPLLIGLAVMPSSGCAAYGDPTATGEDTDVQGITYEEFKATVYQESETGVYIVNGDTPLETERELKDFYIQNVQDGALRRLGSPNAILSESEASRSAEQQRSVSDLTAIPDVAANNCPSGYACIWDVNNQNRKEYGADKGGQGWFSTPYCAYYLRNTFGNRKVLIEEMFGNHQVWCIHPGGGWGGVGFGKIRITEPGAPCW